MRKRKRCRNRRNWCQSVVIKPSSLDIKDGKIEKIYSLLPKLDCGSCGYESCLNMAEAIVNGKESPDACIEAGDKIAYEIKKIIGGDV